MSYNHDYFTVELRAEFVDMRDIDPAAVVILTPALLEGWFPHVLYEELVRYAKAHEYLAFKIINRKPENPELFEGRGAYHLGEQVFYVKGIGSHEQFKDNEVQEVTFPAFGEGLENPFFDSVVGTFNPHPRTLGAETLRWAVLEFLTTGAVLSAFVERLGLTTLEEVHALGLTIPVAVTHFPLLTERIGRSILAYKARLKNSFAESLLEWQGNFEGLGSVALAVPSARRFLGKGVSNTAGRLRDLPIFCLTKEDFSSMGRTLRSLIEAGFVYSYSSAHVQNMYDAPYSICPQADNSDLIPLGALTAQEPNEEDSHVDATFSKSECQQYAIASAILRYLTFASLDPSRAISSRLYVNLSEDEKLEEVQELLKLTSEKSRAFLVALLGEDIPVLSDIISMVPWFGREVAFALAGFVLNQFDENDRWHWDGVAQRLRYSMKEADHLLNLECSKEFEGRLMAQIYYGLNGILEFRKRATTIQQALLNDSKELLRSLPLATECIAFLRSVHTPFAASEIVRSLSEVVGRRNDLRLMFESDGERDIWLEVRESLVAAILRLLESDEELAVAVAQDLPELLELQCVYGKSCFEPAIALDSVLYSFIESPSRESFLAFERLSLARNLAWRTSSNLLKAVFSTEEKKDPSIYELLGVRGCPGVFNLLRVVLEGCDRRVLKLIREYVYSTGVSMSLEELDRLVEEIDLPLFSVIHHHCVASDLEDTEPATARERIELRNRLILQVIQ